MKKRVADIVVETLTELNVKECFCVVGGGAMHLNNAFEINSDMHVTFCHHEQACAFAAEGYAKYSGSIAAVLVTSGPGAVNTLNAVYSAWVDSTPMIVIAGHPRTDTTVDACGLKLRCRGVQEYNIIPSVEGMTKYASMVMEPKSIKKEIVKAYSIAMEGRRGPVWLSIPLDVQATYVEVNELQTYDVHSTIADECDYKDIIERLKMAKKPCILTGSGLRYGNAMTEFRQFIEKVKIPIVGGALLADTLPEGYPMFYGLSGNIGPRAGNYIIQNSDLIIVLGNSLSTRQTGFNVEAFAPNSYFIMVDAEKDEPFKPGLHIDMPICMDVKVFLKKICEELHEDICANEQWLSYCDKVYSFFKNYDDSEFSENGRIPAKHFWKKFREFMPEDAVVALGNSNGVIGIFQYGVKNLGQRVITNYNAGSMGYDLPEAVGVAIASGSPVYCVTGDGSIMMNLQELETISYNKLPIKVVVFSNCGYGAIRQTCKNYFNGVYTGCDSESGVDFPDFEKVAEAFRFKYMYCKSCSELDEKIKQFVDAAERTIMVVEQELDDPVLPKLVSKMRDDGTFEAPLFTDMYPYLSEQEMQKLPTI